MLEVLYIALTLIGMVLGQWLLPKLSGGRLIVVADDDPQRKLPDGQIAVPVEVCGVVFIVLCVAALLAYRLVERLAA